MENPPTQETGQGNSSASPQGIQGMRDSARVVWEKIFALQSIDHPVQHLQCSPRGTFTFLCEHPLLISADPEVTSSRKDCTSSSSLCISALRGCSPRAGHSTDPTRGCCPALLGKLCLLLGLQASSFISSTASTAMDCCWQRDRNAHP